MRKRILFQIIVIVAVFMIVLLFIMDAIISQTSILLFTEAKQELLSRDIQGIKSELFHDTEIVPEFLDYCKIHLDEVKEDVTQDKEFIKTFQELAPGMLERYGVDTFTSLKIEWFPEFSPEEQAAFARMWYYTSVDQADVLRNYYGFPVLALVDISEDNFGGIVYSSTADENFDDEQIRNVIAAENGRNDTLYKYTKGQDDKPEFGIAYDGRRGSWYVGYIPLCLADGSEYVLCIMINLAEFNKTLADQIREVLVLSSGIILLFAGLLIWFINRKTVRPVTQIQKNVRLYTDNKDTDHIVAEMEKVNVNNEFGILAGDIAKMAKELDRFTLDNIKLAADHERLATELELATKIQRDAIPATFPAFPDRDEFDIYASMEPAKEVGGDFYDFFLVDDDHLCMVIADVSGKGVPGALFMMATRIILENNAKMGKSPAQILGDTNAAVCANNREEMFVTVWLGILEISTGKLTAANAGHEYPTVLCSGTEFELFKDKHGFVIGGLDGSQYKDYELQLQHGDKLFLYTDGVTEAANAQNELFGSERMLSALNTEPEKTPKEILKNMREAINHFVQEAEQTDDLTMLCIEYHGDTEKRA